MSQERSRQRWAVLRSGLAWGAAWAIAGGGIMAVLSLLAPGAGVESAVERLGIATLAGISWGIRFGIVGTVIGTMFASAIRLSYRGRRLAQINPIGFTVLGAVVGGIGVPLFLQLMNVLTGGSLIAWGLVGSDAVMGMVFGAAVAGGSILLARRADVRGQGPGPGELDAGAKGGDRLTTGPLETSDSEWRREVSEPRVRR